MFVTPTCSPVHSDAPDAVTADAGGDDTAEAGAVRFDAADAVLGRHRAAEVTPVEEARGHVHVHMQRVTT